MEYTERHFGLCLSDKILNDESLEDIANFACEFRKSYKNGNEVMITILEKLSEMNEEDDDNVIPREKLRKLVCWLQGGVGALPSRKIVFPRFQIDTNRINIRGGLEFMNQLEIWKKEGVIDIDYSQPVLSELHNERWEKAAAGTSTLAIKEEDEADPHFHKIESILFPNGCKDDDLKKDVYIVFHALKYGYILITDDGDSKAQPGGILGNAARLKELGVDVMRDSKAVDMVQNKIIERDEYANCYSEETGMPVPF